jgi:predicted RNA binding protein YcfA (HicA-like mRNA interferase family)
MPTFGPIKRAALIKALKRAGFKGPYAGGKHEFLVRGELRLVLPNPHQGEIGRDLLARLLRQADVSRTEWEMLSPLPIRRFALKSPRGATPLQLENAPSGLMAQAPPGLSL